MKEKSFKFTEAFSKAMTELTDKQAGVLIKGISLYVFKDKPFLSKDVTLKATFELIKDDLDKQREYSENCRKGAEVTNAKRAKENTKISIFLQELESLEKPVKKDGQK